MKPTLSQSGFRGARYFSGFVFGGRHFQELFKRGRGIACADRLQDLSWLE
jgi:hypothetical protein